MPEAGKIMIYLGVMVLATAFLIGPVISYANSDATQTVELKANDSVEVTDELSIRALAVNVTDGQATFRLRDETTLETNETTLNISEGRSLSLSGDSINLDLLDIINSTETSQARVEYPPMFGWDEGPRTAVENIGIIIVLIVFAAVVGYIGAIL